MKNDECPPVIVRGFDSGITAVLPAGVRSYGIKVKTFERLCRQCNDEILLVLNAPPIDIYDDEGEYQGSIG